MAIDALYRLSDNLLEVIGLQDARTSAYLNSATVTVTVVDTSGTPIAGQSWPTTLDYVAGSNGNYVAVLEDALVVTDRQVVTAQITADGGTNLRRYWEKPLQVLTDQD